MNAQSGRPATQEGKQGIVELLVSSCKNCRQYMVFPSLRDRRSQQKVWNMRLQLN
jgi:hypothetical protein